MSTDQRPVIKSVTEATKAVDNGTDVASKLDAAVFASKLKTCLALTQAFTQSVCETLGHATSGIEQIQLRLDVEEAMDQYVKAMTNPAGRRAYAGQVSIFGNIIAGMSVMAAPVETVPAGEKTDEK